MIILSEYCLDEVILFVICVVCMDNGCIMYDGSFKIVIMDMWGVEIFCLFIL